MEHSCLKEVPELTPSEHVTVSAEDNNLIEQSYRPTREQERQQRGFRNVVQTQHFLFTHAQISNLFRHTRTRVPAFERRYNLKQAFKTWGEVSLLIS